MIRNEGQDPLGDLIRKTYTPPPDLPIPNNILAQVMKVARENPVQPRVWDWLRSFFQVPAHWVPATVTVMLLLLIGGYSVFHHSPPDSPAPVAAKESTATRAMPALDEKSDPLGPDFFTVEGVSHEPMTVEVVEGWKAMTIEDEEEGSALVYFYSTDEIHTPTGNVH
jgi:hypothetical protein